jgi:hypothetical protein
VQKVEGDMDLKVKNLKNVLDQEVAKDLKTLSIK